MLPEDGFVPVVRELDRMPKFFIWDMDSACLFLAGFGLATYLGHFVLGAVFGGAVSAAWSRIKGGKARGFAGHFLYWHFPGKPFKRLPPSWAREL